MKISALLGFFIAIVAIITSHEIEGGNLQSLINLPALIVVCCGTLGAVMVETPFPILLEAISLCGWIIVPPYNNIKETSAKMLMWSFTARKDGLLGLEKLIEVEKDVFAKKGLELLVSGTESFVIKDILESAMNQRERKKELAASVFESMGGYAPTIGILGAVLGLIHVMSNLNDPSKLGGGIAAAFVATLYGVGLANIVFLPLGARFQKLIQQECNHSEMIIEGILAISQGFNPHLVECKMLNYTDS